MVGNDASDEEPIVLIEEGSIDIGPFLLWAALGAALALLLAPRSGVETRAAVRRRVHSARQAAEGVAERVTDSFASAREELERRIESARAAVSMRTRQLNDAVVAGRSAAREAKRDLRSDLSKGGVRGSSAKRAPRQRPVKEGPVPGQLRAPRGEP
jgi:gas vesicle protein